MTKKERNQEYYQKNKKVRKRKQSEYYQGHKKERLAYQKARREKNKELVDGYSKKAHLKARKKARKLLGGCCFFCKSIAETLLFHEKFGVKHSSSTFYLVLKDPERFILLCQYCHNAVHWCMKYLKKSWEEIVKAWKGNVL